MENDIFRFGIGSGFGEPGGGWRLAGGTTPPGLIYSPIFTTPMTNFMYLKTSAGKFFAILHKEILKCSLFISEPDQ